MLSKGIKPSLLSSFVSPAFSTISRSMYLEKLRTTKPELKSRPFTYRHLGPNEKDISSMLSFLGMDSLTDLMQKAMPANIIHSSQVRESQAKVLGEASSEETTMAYLQAIADKNQIFKNYIGLGFNPNHLPSAILMNVFMNPTWLTSYTPYQAEISQGRLEALMNFQTLISELTGHELANASLLDEGSSAAEAMYMSWNISDFKKNKFFVDSNVYPYLKKCIRSKAHFLGIEVIEGEWENTKIDKTFCGGFVQNPNNDGVVRDLSAFAQMKNPNFSIDEIKEITEYAHSLNKKVYVTVNPADVDFSGKTPVLVNSKGEEGGITLSPLAVCDEVLSWGYPRAANSGIYVSDATVTDFGATEKVNLNLKENAKILKQEFEAENSNDIPIWSNH